ncbi:hypothetical protein Q767_03370 [Flavobacterium enshiense DK69]|uniref:Uncharacterized protein n=1 Tax=Flavobacterium enshiense DK69 TaxID=1107311 RepID=A0A0A2MZA3_9FLAO|nr:hypothetical protein Q767_03370 [Flavobacterium enshiense DK69]
MLTILFLQLFLKLFFIFLKEILKLFHCQINRNIKNLTFLKLEPQIIPLVEKPHIFRFKFSYVDNFG